jgi:hypothetical protein
MGGAGLSHGSEARTIKRGRGRTLWSREDPFAESVEQLSGFFIVTCDEYDALVESR